MGGLTELLAALRAGPGHATRAIFHFREAPTTPEHARASVKCRTAIRALVPLPSTRWFRPTRPPVSFISVLAQPCGQVITIPNHIRRPWQVFRHFILPQLLAQGLQLALHNMPLKQLSRETWSELCVPWGLTKSGVLPSRRGWEQRPS